MTTSQYSLEHLSDTQLLDGLARVSRGSSRITAALLAHLGEVDARRLFLEQGYGSLFAYCVERLGYSEDETAKRIQAARAARACPALFDEVARGALHLTAVNLLAPHLGEPDAKELIAAARGRSKRQVEEMLAARFPRPEVASMLRKLPMPKADGAVGGTPPLLAGTALLPTGAGAGAASCVGTAGTGAGTRASASSGTQVLSSGTQVPPSSGSGEPARAASADCLALGAAGSSRLGVVSRPAASRSAASRPVLAPLSADRFKLQTTVSRQARDQLLRAQVLLGHGGGRAKLGEVIERAVGMLCAELEARKLGKLRGRRRRRGSTPDRDSATAVQRKPVEASGHERGSESSQREVAGRHDAPAGEHPPEHVGADSMAPTEGHAPEHVGADSMAPTGGHAPEHVGADSVAPAGGHAPEHVGADSVAPAGGHAPEHPGVGTEAGAGEQALGDASAGCEPSSRGGAGPRAGGRVRGRAAARASAPGADRRERRSRNIPRAVKRKVAERDEYRCAYVSAQGRRCEAVGGLEYHHRVAYAKGGEATVEGIELRCRGHNDLQARIDFGEEHMAAAKKRGRSKVPG